MADATTPALEAGQNKPGRRGLLGIVTRDKSAKTRPGEGERPGRPPKEGEVLPQPDRRSRPPREQRVAPGRFRRDRGVAAALEDQAVGAPADRDQGPEPDPLPPGRGGRRQRRGGHRHRGLGRREEIRDWRLMIYD